MWRALSENAPAVLAGGVAGGLTGALVTFFVWWLSARQEMARHLLSEGLRIQAIREAWVLMGRDWETSELQREEPLRTTDVWNDSAELSLFRTELRAVLDQGIWTAPPQKEYAFLRGRRTWVVRAAVTGGSSYRTLAVAAGIVSRPAIVSSRGLEELCGWIEQCASAESGFASQLSRRGLDMLSPLLVAVAGLDRVGVLQSRLTSRARSFLEAFRKSHAHRL